MESKNLQQFENQPIRMAWDEEKETWYFSVVDVVGALTDQPNYDGAKNYWKVLKHRLLKEGSQLVTSCNQLKMKSPKAEPFKLWLARVGSERIEETIDPEQAIDRALETYLKKGYSEEWVHQRLLAIRIRNELTEEWQKRGAEKGKEFAILTDDITKAWSGMTTRQYKNLKGLKKENLRDNMTDTELVLTMLAEASTRDISKAEHPAGFDESRSVAQRGGKVAGTARQALEAETGHPVVTEKNASQLGLLMSDLIEAVAHELPKKEEDT